MLGKVHFPLWPVAGAGRVRMRAEGGAPSLEHALLGQMRPA